MRELSRDILTEAVNAFDFEGKFFDIKSYGGGHINDTFAVRFERDNGSVKRYILQRINTHVFKNPVQLMENIVKITAHIRKVVTRNGGDPMRETLNLVPARDGQALFIDRNGEYWRAYHFIEDTITYDKVESIDDFYNSARAFGKFQQLLADFPAETLHETIPNFHNTVDRMAKFKEALDKDICGRAREVAREIEFVLSHEKDTHVLVDMLNAGRLPLRVTHNDTKLNNVLIDKATGEGICVVDLDTVMPGLSLYDYGDSIRFGATYAAEDEQDLAKVNFELDLFEAYTKGYLEVAGNVLTPCEIEHLPMGAKLITLECGIRFLTDYLSGDTYFRIHREHHNLDRCRTQFKLVSDMEKYWDDMNSIVRKYANKL
ncbi:MAG TPA: aminoglycoside phosphotransferase family protein [Clostridiales bacterium]|nr:aminoglycoside phosphotransferase family protein [Clostridiales bacterium]